MSERTILQHMLFDTDEEYNDFILEQIEREKQERKERIIRKLESKREQREQSKRK